MNNYTLSSIKNTGKNLFLQKRDWIGIILLVALVNGLIYTFIIPPWWHYDEPGHFEYVWMVVHKSPIPSGLDIDENFRRELGGSLEKFDVYKYTGYKLNLEGSKPVWIGVPQYENLPLYYWYLSIPLRLIPFANMATQNYVLRLATLGLLLATVWLAWKITSEITPENHPLRWMIPVFMSVIPGFVELMTSISDDAGAVFTFTLFSWFAIRQITRGFNWKDTAGILISTAMCMLVKNTVWISLPLLVLVYLFVFLRERWSRIIWAGIAVAFIAVLILSTRWGEPAYWSPIYGADKPARVETNKAVSGINALSLLPENKSIVQVIPLEYIRPLRGKTVTIGAWMWSETTIEAYLPIPYFGSVSGAYNKVTVPAVLLTTEPTFHSFSLTVPSDSGRSWLYLNPFAETTPTQPAIFYDNLIMVEGEHPGETPVLEGDVVHWKGITTSNLLRNSSAEKAWFGSSLEAHLGGIKIPIFNWSATLATFQDTQSSKSFISSNFDQLLRTFWAQPAKNYISLLGERRTYQVIAVFTVLALVGFLISTLRLRKHIPWPACFTLGIVSLILWFQTFIRSSSEFFSTQVLVITYARYAAPAITGTLLILCAGWLEAYRWGKQALKISDITGAAIYLAFIFGINILAILSVINFFYLPNGEVQTIFFIITILAVFFALLAYIKPKLVKNP